MKKARCIIYIVLFLLTDPVNILNAATVVYGEKPLAGDRDLDKARKDAAFPTSSAIENAVKSYGCVKVGTEKQPPDCEKNKYGYWFCKGVINAWCETTAAENKTNQAVKGASLADRIQAAEASSGSTENTGKTLEERFTEVEKKDAERAAELEAKFKELEAVDGKKVIQSEFAKFEKLNPSAIGATPEKGVKDNIGSALKQAETNRIENEKNAEITRIKNENHAALMKAKAAEEQRLKDNAIQAENKKRAEFVKAISEEEQRKRLAARSYCVELKTKQDQCSVDTCGSEVPEKICTEFSANKNTDSGNSSLKPGEVRIIFSFPRTCLRYESNPKFQERNKCVTTKALDPACSSLSKKVVNIDGCIVERLNAF
ncbi:hypothetical protein [Pseudomonas fluorescens]|uniref:hypothetical protein n=1 Tax=Pseudomonas fluorescens TaxID=294 RepID=UPI001240EC8D|nr:hypothetical protein [Pseudomonas fluorescens]VVN48012.1 hypothetical protein PS676_05950 [Pseudomonas fluorescens]